MKPIITGLDDALDLTESTARAPLRPRKLTLRVSGARLGSLARPAVDTDGAMATRGATPAALPGLDGRIPGTPRFGLRVHTSPLVPTAPQAPLSPDDYATAEDYE